MTMPNDNDEAINGRLDAIERRIEEVTGQVELLRGALNRYTPRGSDEATSNKDELDDERYDTYLALVDAFDTAEHADERLLALGVCGELLARARRRLAREDAEIAHQEDG